MNGVRRLFASQSSATSAPSSASSSTPPSSAIVLPTASSSRSSSPPAKYASSPPSATPGLSLRKERRPTMTDASFSRPSSSSAFSFSSPGAGPSSVASSPRKPTAPRASSRGSARDELITSVLASEAILDTRAYAILPSNELDDAKREHARLLTRLAAAERTHARELKMRTAAQHLDKLSSLSRPSSTRASTPASSPPASNSSSSPLSTSATALEAANRRVEAAERELVRLKDATSSTGRRILEHQAAVLARALRDLEMKQAAADGWIDAGFDFDPGAVAAATNGTSDGGNGDPRASPALSATSSFRSTTPRKFDGPHLFAGHERARTPRRAPTVREIEALEARLRDTEAARGALEAERGAWDLERESWGEERAALEEERAGWEAERVVWDEERAALEEERAVLQDAEERSRAEADALQSELERVQVEADALREELEREREERDGGRGAQEEVERVLEEERAQWEDERAGWDDERAQWETERAALLAERGSAGSAARDELADVQLAADDAHAELDAERARWEKERNGWMTEREAWDAEREVWGVERDELVQRAKDEVDSARERLRVLIDQHNVPLFARDNSLSTYADALERHLAGAGAGTAATRALEEKLAEEVQRGEALATQLDAARMELNQLEQKIEDGTLASPVERNPSTPLTFVTDAASIVALLRPLWDTLPSPETRAAKFGSPGGARPFRAGSPTASARTPASPSISEMDVRTLKGLYSPATKPPSSPSDKDKDERERQFSVEAFAARVAALIVDDRALIERLIRFAQAHDLLRKNAERAQKLAADSGTALETYQKQVEILERRESDWKEQVAKLEQELSELDAALDRLGQDKLAIETAAGEQASTLQELTEANTGLSARVLALAQEAADAARERDDLRGAGETQQVQQFALLDELNAVQTENGKLRAQLRALGKL